MQSEVIYFVKHCVLCIYGYLIMSLLHSTFFSCWLLSIIPALNILCMLLLWHSLLQLSQDASPPVVSMDILNSSTSKFVTSVEFSNALYSSTLTSLHGCCSFRSVVRMKRLMRTGALLDLVQNTYSILVFANTTVSTEVKPRMEVML